MTRVFALAVGAAMMWAADAEAAVLCARQKAGTFNSTVKIRQACRASETAIDPASLGLQGPPGLQGEAGPGAAVKDSSGKVLGAWSPGVAIVGSDPAVSLIFTSTGCIGGCPPTSEVFY